MLETALYRRFGMPSLLLASSSRWRRELLARLGLPFDCSSPDIDESPLPGESVPALALRLAEAKARALAASHPEHWIIGSDQAAELDGKSIGKPGHHEQARAQLQAQSGRRVLFHTGVCLLHPASGFCRSGLDSTAVQFRSLKSTDIEHYLQREQPYDCAGSFRSEALGIALIERIEGRDPSALVGLPLMLLCDLLAEAGINVLQATPAAY